MFIPLSTPRQDLANLAWAFAQARHRDRTLFAAICRASLPLLPRCGPSELSQLLWALATLNFSSERVCSLVSELALNQLQPPGGSSGGPGSSSEGRGSGSSDSGSSSGGSGSGSSRVGNWQMQSVANVAWAFAIMRPGDTRLFGALFARVDALVQVWRVGCVGV